MLPDLKKKRKKTLIPLQLQFLHRRARPQMSHNLHRKTIHNWRDRNGNFGEGVAHFVDDVVEGRTEGDGVGDDLNCFVFITTHFNLNNCLDISL